MPVSRLPVLHGKMARFRDAYSPPFGGEYDFMRRVRENSKYYLIFTARSVILVAAPDVRQDASDGVAAGPNRLRRKTESLPYGGVSKWS